MQEIILPSRHVADGENSFKKAIAHSNVNKTCSVANRRLALISMKIIETWEIESKFENCIAVYYLSLSYLSYHLSPVSQHSDRRGTRPKEAVTLGGGRWGDIRRYTAKMMCRFRPCIKLTQVNE